MDGVLPRQRRFLPSFATLPSEGWEKDPLVRRTAVGSGRRLASVLPFSVAPGYSRLLPVTPGFTFSGTSLVVLELPGSTGMVGASAVHRRHDASRMPWFHHRRLAL